MYRIFSFCFNSINLVTVLMLLAYGAHSSASLVDGTRSLSTFSTPRSTLITYIPPDAQKTNIKVTFDKRGTPARLFIWDNVFGGSSTPECSDSYNCDNQDVINSLICYSESDATHGACPTKLVWYSTVPANSLKLIFKHEHNTSVTLNLTSVKITANPESVPSWRPSYLQRGFSVYIPSSELNKLNQPGKWHASLDMRVMAWSTCDTHLTTGCDGFKRAHWNAEIELEVTDIGRQQIYFPAFSTARPQVSLNLNNRPGAKNTTASGTTSLDMCLYDGSNSSNRVSLLFQDEGASASGRPAGQFSVYRRGADKNQVANRLDYQVSVINPTTGAAQSVSNGSEIIWTNTDRRNIQRQVVLPGVPGVALCVPAPITLTTPAFRLTDKTAGRYTGTLRIIYAPTTQTSTP